jgi:AcrR family transcriptional regulator
MHAEAPRRKRGRPSEGVRGAILAATLELIGEHGLARVTTKEIAARAGVSEASIYYHFADKPALVEGVVVEAVLAPLREFSTGLAADEPVGDVLLAFGRALESFWRRVLPVLSAVQADVELREHFRHRINALGLGPHRGVRVLGAYLEQQQRAGAVRPDMDARAAAMSVASACFLSAYQAHMLGDAERRKLPSLGSVIATLVELLAPACAGSSNS